MTYLDEEASAVDGFQVINTSFRTVREEEKRQTNTLKRHVYTKYWNPLMTTNQPPRASLDKGLVIPVLKTPKAVVEKVWNLLGVSPQDWPVDGQLLMPARIVEECRSVDRTASEWLPLPHRLLSQVVYK
ncbi:hypothetical protein MYCTH_95584 [Thermothelomyces thermophilus ATCC 42464]|uniref:EH domain-containing protein n=1 Tax=Thermothelomyces thermophilus (strain ATCC 42464 / BCRC 31852 / DSM 1799) TaxID=573729 RepID=G2QIF4_THET4|nr:uncharacterized protein MYCTH_95584 [Thermothelomyces thermophilus ATCC 42464]AEO60328.1 hypothetical protein MYCTH_95584 [Thermothelomyces thermophilus ATCC 42464]